MTRAEAGSTSSQLGPGESAVLDMGAMSTAGPSGVLWSLVSQQLNVNLVSLEAGATIDQHVNDEVDVLVAVESGTGSITIDGVASVLGPTSVALVARGANRSIAAESALVYYSVHVRRAGLQVSARGQR